jgi:N-formylglutamate amidohydrolase
MIPIVLHIPHASRLIPAEERAAFVLDDAALERELTAMTDAWTDELIEMSEMHKVRRVVAPVSRLVCDVERFRDDAEETMAERGMGAVYTHTSDGRPLRQVTPTDRERILRTYYDPHHAALTKAVDDALAEAGACLIIDVHSFPSKPLPYELDQSPDRPEICIGFDDFHGWFFAEAWRDACSAARFRGAANRPFSGSIVPFKHWRHNQGVLSVMIEVRRDLYMDEETGQKLECFAEVGRRLSKLAGALAEQATEVEADWYLTAMGNAANTYVSRMRRAALPYEQRLPLLWQGEATALRDRIVAALGADKVPEIRAQAARNAEEARQGGGLGTDRIERPGDAAEEAHLAEVIEQRMLRNAAMERIQEEGEVVHEYQWNWNGEGESTSPGSSFSACLKEWNGLYAWDSDVDLVGPFASKDEAVAAMNAHCGVSGDGEPPQGDRLDEPNEDDERYPSGSFDANLLVSAMKAEVLRRVREGGRTVAEFCWGWEGEGDNAAPRADSYACVKELDGFFAWLSGARSGGPFATKDEALTSLADHLGLAGKGDLRAFVLSGRAGGA